MCVCKKLRTHKDTNVDVCTTENLVNQIGVASKLLQKVWGHDSSKLQHLNEHLKNTDFENHHISIQQVDSKKTCVRINHLVENLT